MQINSINTYSNSFRGHNTKIRFFNDEGIKQELPVNEIKCISADVGNRASINNYTYTNITIDTFLNAYTAAAIAPDTLETINLY